MSTMVKYAKGLTTFTNLQLLTYRYTGEKYVDFAEFRPGNLSGQDNRRERYEAIITQSIGRSFISLSGWTQSYRNHNSNDIGANLSYNTTVGPVSLSLSGNYGKYNGMDGDDYGGSLSLSLPFSAFDRPHYSSSSIGYSRTRPLFTAAMVFMDIRPSAITVATVIFDFTLILFSLLLT
ncbi:fimbria/pilus outer membrane usher protein [Salmonella enterica]|uniref:Fimbria/pilus outer membrane usher protein n=1 Tax=Salmonella enterica TaxID=28901 RepID=A0A763XM48_SALER|nr:hypothetical protein [Salmonella enterica subsp. enterica serovar Teshie]EHU5826516.1 fimbria/pilus outer membrane usher protein [Salmonella enterica]EHV2050987.1 fimbria/pilus outer membrane usher protein [Salmonella enterica]EHV2059604.1 fimbria/pilus outer membrane usher protein [Salmonella enterica]EHV2069990.1 fimbria/pilus outer membrane usher protein [Salmonella enterica]